MPQRPVRRRFLHVWACAAIFVFADSALGAEPDLAQAQQYYQRAELLKAEPLFLAALPNARGTERRLCYDRLLSIYYRLSRHDRAVQIGQEYRKWLVEGKDEVRAREVQHQIGTCYLVLGHYGKAREQFREVLRETAGPGPAAACPSAWKHAGLPRSDRRETQARRRGPQAVPRGRGVRAGRAGQAAGVADLAGVGHLRLEAVGLLPHPEKAGRRGRAPGTAAGRARRPRRCGQQVRNAADAGRPPHGAGRPARGRERFAPGHRPVRQARPGGSGTPRRPVAGPGRRAGGERPPRGSRRGARLPRQGRRPVRYRRPRRQGRAARPPTARSRLLEIASAVPARVALQGRLATGRRAGRPLGRRVAGRLAPGGRTRNFEHLSWRF